MNRYAQPHDATHDDLEAELASLRPVAPKVDVRCRIAAVVEASQVSQDAPAAIATQVAPTALTWRHCLAPLAAAACLAALITLVQLGIPQPPASTSTMTTPFTLNLDAIIDTTGPTAWVYHHALADSPDALDALLDRHAHTLLPPTQPVSADSIR